MSETRWRYFERNRYWCILSRHGGVLLAESVPSDDRGAWSAKFWINDGALPSSLGFRDEDLAPRHYFDLERAKLEIEHWLKVRNEWLDVGEEPAQRSLELMQKEAGKE